MINAEIEAKANEAMMDVLGESCTQRIIEFFRGVDKLVSVGSLFGLLSPQ